MNGFQVNGGLQVIVVIHLATVWKRFDVITSNCND